MAISSITGSTITGTLLVDDILNGTVGNDTIDGLSGSDTMTGGKGDDTYTVDVTNIAISGTAGVITAVSTGDNVIESISGGIDTVNSSVNYALSSEAENIVATGTAATTLVGNTKDNILDGSGATTGANKLIGGSGNDIYFLGTGDTVVEATGAGTDTIVTSSAIDISVTALLAIEDVILQGGGVITGNGLNNQLFGGAGANTITGGAGNDLLDGGADVDSMTGQTGDDAYYVDEATDVVNEAASQGTDTVYASTTYSLNDTTSIGVENITLIGKVGNDATGNKLNNIILGNGAGNVLDGGIGSDKMSGGFGDDTYKVDSVFDIVTEKAGQGSDTVISTVSISALAANVEKLELSGTVAVNATGNGEANTITGNSKINILSGLAGIDILKGLGGGDTLDGGVGNDDLQGGAGNDLYKVDSSLDKITEDSGAGTGTDSVQFTVTGAAATDIYTLSANVENITLMGTNGIGAAVSAVVGAENTSNNIMTGNSGANSLTSGDGNDKLFGNAGNDTLNAGNDNDSITGGAGKDTITTGTGNDTVVFGSGTTDTSATSYDVLTDFNFSNDSIDLSTVLVANVDITAQSGAVSAASFVANMNTLLSVGGGQGFDTDTVGDVSAAVVTVTSGDLTGSFLAVDINGSGTFTTADFVVQLTGGALPVNGAGELTGFSTDVFV